MSVEGHIGRASRRSGPVRPLKALSLTRIRLIGINAVQLAIALVSNLFLLLNMAQSVRFSVAQPITIVGWYVKM